MLSEYEYGDPYEGEDDWSSTPPPQCDDPAEHQVCVPPAWGERIPGSPVSCRCLLCHEEGRHHAVRCTQCLNAPGCCSCIWGYMRSHYNSGCPLCRHGDPKGENPLGSSQRRQAPRRPSQLVLRGRGRYRRAIGRGLLCGIGRSRGRGQAAQDSSHQQQQTEQPSETHAQEPTARGRGNRGRRGGRGAGRGRATTMEED